MSVGWALARGCPIARALPHQPARGKSWPGVPNGSYYCPRPWSSGAPARSRGARFVPWRASAGRPLERASSHSLPPLIPPIPMRIQRLLPSVIPVLAGLSLGLFSCSGSSSGGSTFAIVSCSLGCSGSGPGGDGQISCGIQDVFVNGELRISFNTAVSDASLTVFTLQVTEGGTGKTPSADRFVDADDPKTVVYRPKLTFDSSGGPVFGLSSGSSYTLKLPGITEDPSADFVRSASGTPNKHRMLCTVEASLGILDPKPGPATVEVTVDVVTSYDPITGEPATFALGEEADGAVDVFRSSKITFLFDDLMNPATLVNPVTGESQSIRVLIDPDGITSDSTDQQPLLGTFTIFLDQDALTTVVTFESELGFPSAGSDPITKRKVVLDLPPTISDLGGNPLSNFGQFEFTPEFIPFTETTLEEPFITTAQQDIGATGGDWGQSFAGILLPGIGGGSGRLGHLFLDTGQTITLNTDSEDFSIVTDPAIFDPASVLDATFDGTSFVFPPIVDGVFEFASLRLNSGSKLRFEGSIPARVFVRGVATIQGRLDVSGADAPLHLAKDIFGGEATVPGPSGGAGGDGGRLPTWEGFESVPGTTIPPIPLPPAPTLAEINGQPGADVPDNILTPSGTFGGGGGGLAWPQSTAEFPGFHLPVDVDDIFGVEFDIVVICQTKMKGGVGAGGGYGLNGGVGLNAPIPGAGLTPVEAPDPVPGLASDFGLGIGSDHLSPERTLDPEFGHLHGGGGGAGGGGHIAVTATNGKVFVDCTETITGTDSKIISYQQTSAAAGGAGGGGVQLQAGAAVVLDGVLDAGGGAGGDKDPASNVVSGGGGAGGAVLIQSPVLQLTSVPGTINVNGGAGGFGVGASLGGDGGSGLIRYETSLPLPDVDTVAEKFGPTPADLAAVGALPIDVYSIGEFIPSTTGPGKLNGAQSCWLRPDGNFFLLELLDDGVDTLGWDLTFLPNPVSLGEQSYRGDNPLYVVSFEDAVGTDLGVAPFIVRFQGARAIKTIDDLCDVSLSGEDAQVFPGSITGWVKHPAELNAFFADPALRPNMIRFQIIFDASSPIASLITGITSLTISVLPD